MHSWLACANNPSMCVHVRAAFEEEKVAIRKKMASSMSTVLGSKDSAADRVGSTQLADDEQPQVVPQPFAGLICRACQVPRTCACVSVSSGHRHISAPM